MAEYCRVSTDQEEQLLSYENQVNYYTNYISENPLYEYAGTYADEGISGTNTKKRDEFNRMIADCRAGKIDMIITKSIYQMCIRDRDGGVQYVSNRIIPSENNYRETWHTPRLTLEEWEELYGGE